jgi:hypothetical protein
MGFLLSSSTFYAIGSLGCRFGKTFTIEYSVQSLIALQVEALITIGTFFWLGIK